MTGIDLQCILDHLALHGQDPLYIDHSIGSKTLYFSNFSETFDAHHCISEISTKRILSKLGLGLHFTILKRENCLCELAAPQA